MQAPWAWAQGYTGAGIVVAGQDTGYDFQHPALQRAYRGYNAATDAFDHAYNWHDAIHADIPPEGNVNVCGYNNPIPCDDGSHGTHTMGTIVGNDLDPADPAWPADATNAIGVAPGAGVDRLPQHGKRLGPTIDLHRVLPMAHRALPAGWRPPSRRRPQQSARCHQQFVELPAGRDLPGAGDRARGQCRRRCWHHRRGFGGQ